MADLKSDNGDGWKSRKENGRLWHMSFSACSIWTNMTKRGFKLLIWLHRKIASPSWGFYSRRCLPGPICRSPRLPRTRPCHHLLDTVFGHPRCHRLHQWPCDPAEHPPGINTDTNQLYAVSMSLQFVQVHTEYTTHVTGLWETETKFTNQLGFELIFAVSVT